MSSERDCWRLTFTPYAREQQFEQFLVFHLNREGAAIAWVVGQNLLSHQQQQQQ